MDLQSLINVVGKKGKRNAFILSSLDVNFDDVRVNDLYQGLKTNKYKDEAHAARRLFNTDTSDKNYIKLRSKLKEALFQNLFFLNYDNKRHPEHAKVEYEARKNLLQAKVLLREGDKNNAEWLVQRTIKLLEPYHFTEELLECYTILRNQTAYSGNLSKFSTINEEVVRLTQIRDAQKEAEFLIYASICNILKSLVNKRRFVKDLKGWIKKTEGFKKKYDTPFLILADFRLKSSYFTLIGDHDGLLKICDETEKSFQKNPSAGLHTKRTEISLNKMYAYLNLKKYNEGKKYAQSNLKYFTKDNNNWFSFMENYFLLCMRTENYDKAGEVLDEVKTNVFYRTQPEFARERWYIYQGYYAFFRPDHKPKFQIQNFLGQIPKFDKTKFGYNASALIIHFFHLLKEDDYDEIHLRMNEMKKYTMKQITRSGNERLQAFLRLLQLVYNNNFNYKISVEKSQNYLGKLKRFKGRAEVFEELEVIEYEVLWEMLLEMLKSKSRYYKINP